MTDLIEKSQFNLTNIPTTEIEQMKSRINEMKIELTQEKQKL